ncbi:MAG: C25 family cysteine peptidase, partial [Flavobacteriales bacterium]
MKNICSLVIICVLTPWLAFGASAGSNHIRLLGSDLNTSVIRLETGDFSYSSVQTGWGQAKLISTEGAVKLIKEGAPELPAFSASLVIPDLARMELEIIGATYTEYTDIDIAPSKGFLLRNQDPSSVPYAKGEEYNQNSFYPGKLADLHKPYILRDFRGQTLSFYPFQYNPQTKVLRVYKELTVKIYKADDNGLNPFYRERPFEHVQAEFNKIYSRHFLNYSASVSRYTPVEEQGNMLVISHGPFMSDMAPFVYWKKQKGINVEMVDVSTIGNATAIENYISNYYTNNGLAFVLLVGDAQYVPCSMTGAGDSDNKYGYISGNDSYPEVLVGRFSCETNAEVQTMVDRVLRYEKTPPTSGSWYTTGLGIASDQGPGDDNEMDFEHIRNIRTDLLGFTYSTVHEMYDGSQGGADATGSPTPSMVGNAVNSGLSIINYCGHGSSYSFGTSGFSGNDVDQLTNVDMCPFIFSVACVNGQFVGQTCFAEKWLRATDNNTGEPTGAIGAMMSTINQSWDPPMDAQDEMNDILTEMYSNNIKRTFAGIGINGCLQMNDDYGQQGDDMTDTWTVFGDPSVMVRTAVPGSMTVTHVTSVNTGETSTLVNCNTDDAVICL